jgi:DNA polymerase III epsilon subunit-like protein
MSDFVIYVIDTETTGLNYLTNEIIEISLHRLSDNATKTVCIQPQNFASIEERALAVNGHKLEDLQHKTDHGRATYIKPSQAIIEIENFVMEDCVTAAERVVAGQNSKFDIDFMKQLWKSAGSESTYLFGRHYLDTQQIAFFLDLITGNKRKYYNLGSLADDFGIKKGKAHTAAGDVDTTVQLLHKQMEFVKNGLKK